MGTPPVYFLSAAKNPGRGFPFLSFYDRFLLASRHGVWYDIDIIWLPWSGKRFRMDESTKAKVKAWRAKLAELRGEDPEEVAAYTTENAKRVYGL